MSGEQPEAPKTGEQPEAPKTGAIDKLSYARLIPFARHLGFELVKFENGESEILYTAKPEHLNTFDVTHGGACMTLLDVTMAAAARSQTPEDGVVTIEMKTSFMQPSVGPLSARGRLIHRTASLAFVEATIYDEAERVCAHSTGTFKYVKKRGVIDRLPSTD